MTLSTSVTNPIKQRLKKTILWYTLISAFFFVGSRIYEHFSFGETSAFMHYLFLIPLIGGALLVALQLVVKGLSRLTLNLWNSAVATATAGASTEVLLTSLVVQQLSTNPTIMLQGFS